MNRRSFVGACVGFVAGVWGGGRKDRVAQAGLRGARAGEAARELLRRRRETEPPGTILEVGKDAEPLWDAMYAPPTHTGSGYHYRLVCEIEDAESPNGEHTIRGGCVSYENHSLSRAEYHEVLASMGWSSMMVEAGMWHVQPVCALGMQDKLIQTCHEVFRDKGMPA